MELSDRIAEQIARLPPELKTMLDLELAAGNKVIDVELGRGERKGQVALILNHPFRNPPSAAPDGVSYREMTDRDPQIFEFHTADEKFSLITAKFKPIKLHKIVGPENLTEQHIAFMKERMRKEEEAAAARERQKHEPPPPSPPPPPLTPETAYQRFIGSMNVTYEMWHDGIGYDLDALALMSASERESAEKILIEHSPRDWRDIEALAHIDSPQARAEVEKALKSRNPQVREEAQRHIPEKIDPKDRERLLVHALENSHLYEGLSQAIDEVPDFHTPAVIDALFRGALRRDGESAVHFAALLFFLHGKATEPFDWDHRPFFLRFNTEDRKEREVAFRELCEIVGMDAGKYLRT